MMMMMIMIMIIIMYCQYGKVSFKEKPTWCTIHLQYISSSTSTCFGRIYGPSSGGTPYGYNNCYLLFFL